MVDDFKSRGGSPWGSPPGGGGNGSGRRGPTPPNIDEIIKILQDKIKKDGKLVMTKMVGGIMAYKIND